MRLGSEEGKVKSSWDVCKSKERKKKKKDGTEAGCWVKLRFIGSCISSRSKVDSSVSGTSTHFGNSYFSLFFFGFDHCGLIVFVLLACQFGLA
jgi:hypothetical protein